MVQYLKEKITESKGEGAEIKCPAYMCNSLLREDLTIELLTNFHLFQLLSIYKNLVMKNNLNFIPCPIPDCNSYGNKSNIDKGVLKCENDHEFCVFCRKEPHLDKMCDLININNSENSTSISLVKKCPKCFNMIEKTEESNLVICSGINCGYKLCWICLSNCTKAHYINPMSTCFGLEYTSEKDLTEHDTCIRKYKWLVLVFLGIIVLPILFSLFSFALFAILLIYSELNSYLTDIPFLTKERQENFRKFSIVYYVFIGLPLLPLGYLLLGVLLITSPVWIIVLCIFYQKRKIEDT